MFDFRGPEINPPTPLPDPHFLDLLEPAQGIMVRHEDPWPFKEGGSVGAGAVCLNQATLHPDQCF